MDSDEIHIYGEELAKKPSAVMVFLLLATIGIGVPIYLSIAEDFSFVSLLITVFLLMVLLALWALYNEDDILVLSGQKIHFKKRFLTTRYRSVLSIDLDQVKEISVTRIVHLRMTPKSLFTFVHHDGQVTEQWVGLVMEKNQENKLKAALSARNIQTLFEE